MTVKGYDISHNNGVFDHEGAYAAGYRFCYVKATEGREWQDDKFHRNREAALDAGLYFAAYHWLRSDSPPRAQANNLADVLGKHRPRTPVVIDFEPVKQKDGSQYESKPSLQHVRQFMEACEDKDINVTLLYCPRWYWSMRGEPGLKHLPPIINSHYGAEKELERWDLLYPGDDSERWKSYGGVYPKMLQFTEHGIVGQNKKICLDAYRGELKDLSRWFYKRDDAVVEPPPDPDPEPTGDSEEIEQILDAIRELPKIGTRLQNLEDQLTEVQTGVQEIKAALAAIAPSEDDLAGVVEDEVTKVLGRLRLTLDEG